MAEPLEDRALLSSTPAMVADIVPGRESPNLQNLVAIGPTIYFTASDGNNGTELWKSDGTAAGTTLVKDIFPGESTYQGTYGGPYTYPNSSNPTDLTNVNGTLFFRANDGVNGYELWKSDGTPAGTKLVKDIFSGISNSYPTGPNSSNPANLTTVNGTLYFTATDGVNGRELWKSDGTTAGTKMVKDIVSGAGSYARYLTSANGTLFFSVDDRVNGYELWKSDGTDSGTTMVKDISPGQHGVYDSYGNLTSQQPNSSVPQFLTNVNGTLFFAADSGAGRGLWQSDGTPGGTVPFGPSVSISGPPTNVNGTLYFAGTDAVHGEELWKSDGTVAGTKLVKDIVVGETTYYVGGNPYYPGSGHWETFPNSSRPASLTDVNGTLVFTAGGNIWKSDGTDTGTVKVADTSVGKLTSVNGTLYFLGTDGTDGYELWKSNGTAAGTVRVMDIFPGPNSSEPGNLTNANGTLFFTASDGVHGTELWALNTVPAPSLNVGGFPAMTTAGSAGNFTITAKNADETTNTGYLGTVHFTSTDPQAVLPADYTFTTADHGVHTFTAKLKTAGYQAITATDAQAPGMYGSETNILVKPAAASMITVDGVPSTTTAGAANSYVSVVAKDPYGNIATGYTGSVRFTANDAKAVLPPNYTFTAADAGQHGFFTIVLKTAGTHSITVTDTLNSSLTGTQGGIIVIAGAASQFLISTASSVASGAAFSLTLTVQDAYGNIVTNFTGTVRFTSTDKSATLPANYTFTASDHGVHTFTGLILRKKGNQTITVTSPTSPNTSLSASVVESVR
jgi:ELWxxDGT repeat protein